MQRISTARDISHWSRRVAATCGRPRPTPSGFWRVATGPDAGVASAHLALAWIHVERDHHEEAARHLTLAADSDARPEAWIGTVRTLLEARLLLRTRPDSAVQLLAHGSDEWWRTTSYER